MSQPEHTTFSASTTLSIFGRLEGKDEGVTTMLHDKTKERRRKANQFIHWAKESKENRKLWMGKHRAEVREAIAHEDFEKVPLFKASGGWLTW